MKNLLLACLLASAVPLPAAIEFSGYMSSGSKAAFVLTETTTGQTSDWLSIGGTFRGHKVIALADEVLIVEHEGKRLELPLKAGAVKSGAATTAPAKTAVAVAVNPDGSLAVGGKPLPFDELVEQFRRTAATGAHLAVAIHEPPHPDMTSHAGTQKIAEAIKASGAKKWSIKIVNHRDAATTQKK